MMISLRVSFILASFLVFSDSVHSFSSSSIYFQKNDQAKRLSKYTRTTVATAAASTPADDNVECSQDISSDTNKLVGDLKTVIGTFFMTCVLALQPWTLHVETLPFTSENRISVVGFQRSQAWALNEEQALVDEVWREVTRQFVDPTFAGQGEDGWRQKRLDAVKKATTLTPDDRQEMTYEIIRSMLKSLKDPYTRYLTPEQFQSLTNYATGKATTGIGVQLLGDPKTGDIVVVNTVTGGPAEKAGILPGDIVVEIDGTEVKGATAEVVAAKCRGAAGSQVTVTVRHGTSEGKPQTSTQVIDVTRGAIPTIPVQVSTFESSNGKQMVGLIKVSSFNSQETTKQVEEAITQLRSKRVSALVIDLRGNAGGYMPAGVDVAKLFLPPQARIVSEVDKKGRATIYLNEGVGASETDLPLYILVDQRTASASEIMAAALQDNHRATIVGASSTFGKGRIQNVLELSDGGIAVTKAKYITPEGKDIQGVGLSPDKKLASCEPTDSASACLKGIL